VRPQPLDSEAVNRLAAAKGIDSVSELARRCDLNRPYLSRILRGARPAYPSHILALAEALDCAPADILRDEVTA
jgi:transcriptional regulator with XRE-family HTH domain